MKAFFFFFFGRKRKKIQVHNFKSWSGKKKLRFQEETKKENAGGRGSLNKDQEVFSIFSVVTKWQSGVHANIRDMMDARKVGKGHNADIVNTLESYSVFHRVI